MSLISCWIRWWNLVTFLLADCLLYISNYSWTYRWRSKHSLLEQINSKPLVLNQRCFFSKSKSLLICVDGGVRCAMCSGMHLLVSNTEHVTHKGCHSWRLVHFCLQNVMSPNDDPWSHFCYLFMGYYGSPVDFPFKTLWCNSNGAPKTGSAAISTIQMRSALAVFLWAILILNVTVWDG